MADVVPYQYFDLVRPKRDTRKQVARIKQAEIVERAASDAGSRAAARRTQSDELAADLRAQLRLENGYQLAAQAVANATALSHLVSGSSRGNPGLEASLRDVEETAKVGAIYITYRYMTRP